MLICTKEKWCSGIMAWRMVFLNDEGLVKEMFRKQNLEKYKYMLSFYAVPAI